MENKSFRNTCFTLNNWTEEEYEAIIQWDCKYLIVGKEVGKEGTPHLQGYVEWKSSKKFDTLKNLNERIHWEERKGKSEQAATYCKKEGNFFEKGKLSKPGKRTDLEKIGDLIIEKTPMKEIALQNPAHFIRYHRGMKALAEILKEDRKERPYVEWRWGSTGVGKTRYCVEKHKSYYIKDGTKWWDGYDQQEAIIIDDFAGMDLREFLRLCDWYKYQGEVKTGYTKINSPFIYITCDKPPSHFWTGEELEQASRRIDLIVEVKKEAAEVNG